MLNNDPRFWCDECRGTSRYSRLAIFGHIDAVICDICNNVGISKTKVAKWLEDPNNDPNLLSQDVLWELFNDKRSTS